MVLLGSDPFSSRSMQVDDGTDAGSRDRLTRRFRSQVHSLAHPP